MLTKPLNTLYLTVGSKDMSNTIDGQKFLEKMEVKYLGVNIDKKLALQAEEKNL